MNATRMLALMAMLGAALGARTQQSARDEMNEGTAAYKRGRYADAAAHFKRAMELNPNDLQAQLYLATAYYIQWVPGADSPENQQAHDLASEQFQAVLAKEPNNGLALAMLASMAYNAASAVPVERKAAALDEAASWNQRRVEADPSNAEPYYYLGVIAWAKAFAPIQSARVQLGMGANQPGPIMDSKVRATLQSQYERTIEEGLVNLKRCLELDPKHDDAMAYLNLLLRNKAELEDLAEAAKADMGEANEWISKSMDTKKWKAAQSAPSPSGEATLLARLVAPPPPPPSPPPPPARPGPLTEPTVRIGGRVAEANLVRKVEPVYPGLAKAARVQGLVEFTVVITRDGLVESAELVRGHPLLVGPAKEALMQWRYRPTLLNGAPVRVMTDVVIEFSFVP